MLDYYFNDKFDTKKYLSDYKLNKITLSSLRLQLEELTEIKGQSNNGKVQTSPKFDGLENLAIHKIKIKEKILAYESYFNTYERAWDNLTDEEKYILDIFFKHRASEPLYRAKKHLGFEKSHVYEKLREAIKKFEKLIIG